MQVNTNQKIHCYTQGQQGIASILLIVCLLASLNLESALATSESTGDTRAPLLSQLAEDQDSSLRQYAQGSFETADDKTRQLLHQAAKEQDPTLRQASASALAYLATANDKTRQLLDQAAKEQDEDVRKIALAALKTLEPIPSTSHTDKKQVLQKFFKQAVATNDVPRLSKLILEHTDEVGELCESLEADLLRETLPQTADTLLTWGVTHNQYKLVEFIIKQAIAPNDVPRLTKLILENIDEVGELVELLVEEKNLLMKTLPQTADKLLTWGVTHNKYELVQLIIKHGRQHLKNNNEGCVGKTATKIAAQKGYRELFLLLINNAIDVDNSLNITAFTSAIICREFRLAQAMIRLGEYRLEQRDKRGLTPQAYLKKKRSLETKQELQNQADDLERLLLQKFFKQAVAINDVPRLTELILENTDEVGELCESLAVDQIMAILPQTADTLLTWGVEHNKYELVQFIIEHGRQHITNKLGYSLGQKVTKRAAQKGYQ